METIKRIHIFISGRVQGVLFRQYVLSVAQRLGIMGFTRNLPDGRVEIIGEGDKGVLLTFLHECEIGSKLSSVHGVEYSWHAATEEFRGFELVRHEKGYVKDKIEAVKNLAHGLISKPKVPEHLVLIPDGNRRWAKLMDLATWKGHAKGGERAKELLEVLCDSGVKYVTLWGFSTENWKRSEAEVQKLMELFAQTIHDLKDIVHEHKIRFVHFGRKSKFSESLHKEIVELEEATKDYEDYHLGIALDYGGREELLSAVNQVKDLDTITEDDISRALYTKDFPDPDFIIRTGGEQRLSGMMPWQSVYAELYFPSKLFPDFCKEDMKEALNVFASRKRRLGK